MTQDQIKKYLGIVLTVAIAVFAIAALGYVVSFSRSTAITRIFNVTGEGKIVAVPDIMEFNLSVITEGGKNLVELQKSNSEKINKIVAYLKDKGIKDKDIKTQQYYIEPRYQYYTCDGAKGVCPPSVIAGYTVRQIVDVKIRDFDKIGDILTGVVENGANSVSDLSFAIDDRTKLEDQARQEAISKAKEKARSMARAGGFRLGKLVSINESFSGPYYYENMKSSAVGYGVGGGGDVAPTVEPGSQDVIINMTLQYEIR